MPKIKTLNINGTDYDIAVTNGYESIVVNSGISTMASLRSTIDTINGLGEHYFFDFHNYITDAYICTVHAFTSGNKKFCFIFDVINQKLYGDYAGYTDEETVSAYLSTDVNDILKSIKISDATITLGDIAAKLSTINTLNDHVLFDVSALNTGMYLCAIYLDNSIYKVFDIVTGKLATGNYSADALLYDVLSYATSVATQLNVNNLQNQIDELRDLATNKGIYGVKFYGNNPTGVRTDSASSFTVNSGVDNEIPTNDFDNIITALGLITEVTDVDTNSGVNKFIKVAKHYIQRVTGTDTTGNYRWYRFSMFKHPGFSLPAAFCKADGGEYEAVYLGKYKAVYDGSGNLRSAATIINIDAENDVATVTNPIAVNLTMDNFIDKANNNGYEIESFAEYEMWSHLMKIIQGTLNDQALNSGYTSAVSIYPYYKNTATSAPSNDSNIPASTGLIVYCTGDQTAYFKAGVVLNVVNRSYVSRVIKQATYDSTNNYTAIELYKNSSEDTGISWTSSDRCIHDIYTAGTTDSITPTIGSKTNKSNGKFHFHQYGLEDHFGCVWEHTAYAFKYDTDFYITLDKTQGKNTYRTTSNTKYNKIISGISSSNGWCAEKKYAEYYPELGICSSVSGADSSKYYCDYYYYNSGYRTVLVGGNCDSYSYAGSSYVSVHNDFTSSNWHLGARLSATSKLGG